MSQSVIPESSTNPPALLFKYVRADEATLRSIIVDNGAKFTCPLEFNDPFDCLPVIDMASTAKQCLDAIKRVVKRQQIPRSARGGEIKRLFRLHRRGFDQAQGETAWTDTLRMMGVLSLSERSDSIVMWSHYADQHKGVCVGFATDHLPSTLFPVAYEKRRPVYYWAKQQRPESNAQMYTSLCTKDEDWRYEHEWRVILRRNGIVSLGAEALQVVIIGERTSVATQDLVNRLAAERPTEIQVERASMHPSEYRMVRSAVARQLSVQDKQPRVGIARSEGKTGQSDSLSQT